MAANKAVQMIVDIIEKDCESEDDPLHTRRLEGYAQLLKVAMLVEDAPVAAGLLAPMPAELQHARMIERERENIRAQRAAARGATRAELEEIVDPRLVSLQGGPCDGDVVPVAPDMPEGARTNVDGLVYQLRKGRLVLELPQTLS